MIFFVLSIIFSNFNLDFERKKFEIALRLMIWLKRCNGTLSDSTVTESHSKNQRNHNIGLICCCCCIHNSGLEEWTKKIDHLPKSINMNKSFSFFLHSFFFFFSFALEKQKSYFCASNEPKLKILSQVVVVVSSSASFVYDS